MNKWLTKTVEAYIDHFGTTQTPVIWDVGSRDGRDATELAERVQTDGNALSAEITCIEPNPPQARLIRETFPQVTVHEVAVSDWEGTSDFVRVVSDNMDAVGMSSLDVAHQETKGHWAKEIITVKVTRLDSLMPTSPVDIMKIDCEGYSWEVLHGMGEKLHNVRVFHIETEHPEFSSWSHKGHKNNEQVMDFMLAKGFELYATEYEWGGIQDQVWVNKNINRTGIDKTPSQD